MSSIPLPGPLVIYLRATQPLKLEIDTLSPFLLANLKHHLDAHKQRSARCDQENKTCIP